MPTKTRQFHATADQRLDKYLFSQLTDLSRNQVQQLIKEGQVLVDGESMKAGQKLKGGEVITVTIDEDVEDTVIIGEDIPLDIVYEDEVLAVIHKPAGMVVQPGLGNESGTLVHAIVGRWDEIAEMAEEDDDELTERMGIVHRLDKGTSGLLVVAKQKEVLQNLMAQFQSRTVEKTYLALLERTPETPTGRIEAPIGRDPKQRKRMAVLRDGKPASTEFQVIEDQLQEGRALVKVNIHTGRTHQIRVHMAFIGCPVVGDTVYGFRKQRVKLKRLFLHATELQFDHPISGERCHFEAPMPYELNDLLLKLRLH